MHDGSLNTLEQVVEFYNQGGFPNANLNPDIRVLNLNTEEKQSLVAFLTSLTGANVCDLISDALTTAISDPD